MINALFRTLADVRGGIATLACELAQWRLAAAVGDSMAADIMSFAGGFLIKIFHFLRAYDFRPPAKRAAYNRIPE